MDLRSQVLLEMLRGQPDLDLGDPSRSDWVPPLVGTMHPEGWPEYNLPGPGNQLPHPGHPTMTPAPLFQPTGFRLPTDWERVTGMSAGNLIKGFLLDTMRQAVTGRTPVASPSGAFLDPADIYARLPQPSPGGTIHQLPIGNGTFYLYNDGSTAPPPTTSTTLPQAGAASAADLPPELGAQSYATNLQGLGQLMGMPAVASRHEQFSQLRALYRLLGHGGLAPEEMASTGFPLIQQLWNQGTIYQPGGEGMSFNVPFYDPTHRIMNLFEQYQDYLNAGNRPVPPMGALGMLPP